MLIDPRKPNPICVLPLKPPEDECSATLLAIACSQFWLAPNDVSNLLRFCVACTGVCGFGVPEEQSSPANGALAVASLTLVIQSTCMSECLPFISTVEKINSTNECTFIIPKYLSTFTTILEQHLQTTVSRLLSVHTRIKYCTRSMSAAISGNKDLGRLFAAKMKGDAVDMRQQLNAQRWLTVGSAQYFVLKTFSDSDSEKITAGLKAPETFMFTNLGNISCNNFTFKNPIDPNATTDYGQASISTLAATSNQYVFDSNTVITPNLLYVLKKQGSTWYLLFNAIHSSHFRAFYADVVSSPNVTLTWGATPVDTDVAMSVQRVFRNHCNALQTTNTDGTSSFVDPTCNIIYSDAQCRNSSFFVNNATQQPPDKLSRYASALQALGSGAPPHCICTGAPHDYVVANVDKTKSFIFDFQQLSTCKPSLEMNVCEMITQGGTNNIKDSQFNMQCGGNTNAIPSSTTQGTNVKDDGGAAAAAAQLAAQQSQQAQQALIQQAITQALAKAQLPATPALAASKKGAMSNVNMGVVAATAASVAVALGIAFLAFRPFMQRSTTTLHSQA